MKKYQASKILQVTGVALLALAGGYVWAQQPQGLPGGRGGPPGGPPGGPGGGQFHQQEEAVPLPEPQMQIQARDGYWYITTNGVPDHPTGKFPNANNPNAIRAQNYKFRVPLQPKIADKVSLLRHDLFGVAASGVPFDPATGEFWNNDRRWNYDALSGKINLGMDMNNAHVQPGGVYHYHGLPTGVINKRYKKNLMTLVGLAADGFPIYAVYGHATAHDAKTDLKKLRSSYRLKEGTRPAGNDGPGGVYDGTFIADWEYVAGAGDLDECNGRIGVTPEYPNGTYYYIIGDEFPFIPRAFRGTPDSSFVKPRPQGGQGGPRSQGGPGGPPWQGGPGRPQGPPPGGPPPGGPPPR